MNENNKKLCEKNIFLNLQIAICIYMLTMEILNLKNYVEVVHRIKYT